MFFQELLKYFKNDLAQAAILGVCAIQDELAMDDDGNLFKKQVMRLSVTLDHRLLDGAVVAKFEMDLRDMLQSPMSILL